jgi:hypothetical protein
MAALLQAAMGSTQSERLKQAFKMGPRLLEVYFRIALRDVNDCMLIILSRFYLDVKYLLCYEVYWRFLKHFKML